MLKDFIFDIQRFADERYWYINALPQRINNTGNPITETTSYLYNLIKSYQTYNSTVTYKGLQTWTCSHTQYAGASNNYSYIFYSYIFLGFAPPVYSSGNGTSSALITSGASVSCGNIISMQIYFTSLYAYYTNLSITTGPDSATPYLCSCNKQTDGTWTFSTGNNYYPYSTVVSYYNNALNNTTYMSNAISNYVTRIIKDDSGLETYLTKYISKPNDMSGNFYGYNTSGVSTQYYYKVTFTKPKFNDSYWNVVNYVRNYIIIN